MGRLATLGDRWRVFFIGVILSVWLVIIDGLNYSFNWDEDPESESWAKLLLLISGYLFAFPTIMGCFMLFTWCSPKTGAVIVIFPCLVAGAMRLAATLIGFQDFWQTSTLDSTTSGTTDVAIAALQVYLMFDAHYLYRCVGKSRDRKGYDSSYDAVNPVDSSQLL